jgi:hypothetical protein
MYSTAWNFSEAERSKLQAPLRGGKQAIRKLKRPGAIRGQWPAFRLKVSAELYRLSGPAPPNTSLQHHPEAADLPKVADALGSSPPCPVSPLRAHDPKTSAKGKPIELLG